MGKEKKPPGPSGQVTSARNKPGWVHKMVLLRGWWWWHSIYSDLTVPNKAEEVDYNERKDNEEDGAGHEEVRVLLFPQPEGNRDVGAVVEEDECSADDVHGKRLVAVLVVDRGGREGGGQDVGGGEPEAASGLLVVVVLPLPLHIRLVGDLSGDIWGTCVHPGPTNYVHPRMGCYLVG